MTAALSADGELFLWGQANPGMTQELSVLKGKVGDVDQDEYVRCVELEIEGKEACVTDVAVGLGHVLVAAEVVMPNQMLRRVFAAGQGENGQLGLGAERNFVEEFVEVDALRGTRVRSLKAAGWSSWAVAESEQ